MTAHAKLSPSTSGRWLDCTASATIDVSGLEDRQSPAAERGTRLHEVSERFLRSGKKPTRKACVDDVGFESVKAYVAYVRALEGEKYYEQRLTLSKDCWGTGDAVVVDEPVLEVVDAKFGTGVLVEATDNTQLMIYGLAAYKRYSLIYDRIESVRMTVHQKAKENVDTWEVPVEELLEFGEEVEAVIAAIKRGDVVYSPSESNCMWCPAKAICPEVGGLAQAVAKEDFKDLGTFTWERKLELAPVVEARAKGVRDETKAMMLRGEPIEGFKVVQGRRGNRGWGDEEKMARALKKRFKLADADVRKPGAIISPKGVEDLLQGMEVEKKKRDAFVGKHVKHGAFGPPTVVADDDPREEIDRQALARRDFEVDEEDES